MNSLPQRRRTHAPARSSGYASSFFYRCGKASAGNRRTVCYVWLILVGCSLFLLPFLLKSLGLPPAVVYGSESARADSAIAKALPPFGRGQMMLVFRSEQLPAPDRVYRGTVAAAVKALRQQPGVVSVQPLPLPVGGVVRGGAMGPFTFTDFPYRDAGNAYVFVAVQGSDTELASRFPAQRSAAEQAVREASDGRVHAHLVGATSINYDLRKIEIAEVRVVEGVALVLALLVLLLGLGSIGSALVPLALAGAVITTTSGIFTVLGQVMSLDTLLLTVITLVGLGVGIDYSLLVLGRYREELGRGRPREEAAGAAVATAGKTVYLSGLTAAVSVLCLGWIRMPIFREFAVGMFVVILVALVAVLTLLPALLVWWTPRLDWGRLPWRRFSRPRAARSGERWARWAGHLMRRPWPYLVAVTVLLVGSAVPAMSMKLGVDLQRPTLTESSSGQGLAALENDSFEGALGTLLIFVKHPPGGTTAGASALIDALRADGGVATVGSFPGSDFTAVVAIPKTGIDAPGTAELVRRVRGNLVPAAVPPGYRVLVGGPTALLLDGRNELDAKSGWTIVMILLMSFGLLVVAFRSLLIPLKAIVMNLLTTGASFGLLVLVFQHGPAAPSFGVAGTGTIQAFMPLVIFALLFGLSLDYEVFLVRRIQESYLATGDTTRAVIDGVHRTARTIFLAATIMIVVFAGMLFSSIPEIKQFGFTLMVAFAIDATLIRFVLVPASMKILGRWNWWLPQRLARVLPPRPAALPAPTPPAPEEIHR